MQTPMNAPAARNSKSIGCPAPTFAARLKMIPTTIATIAQEGSNRMRRSCFIIALMPSSKRVDLAIVVAVAVIANFAYLVFSNGDYYFPDSFTYLAPARAMLRGAGFLGALGRPETLRTPGYPLLLVLFGAHTLPVLIFQHFLNVALAVA